MPKDTATPEARLMNKVYRLYGDMPADAARKVAMLDPTFKDLPSRQVFRTTWKSIRPNHQAHFTGYYETSDGRRFLSRQGRYRYCRRTGAVAVRLEASNVIAVGEEE